MCVGAGYFYCCLLCFIFEINHMFFMRFFLLFVVAHNCLAMDLSSFLAGLNLSQVKLQGANDTDVEVSIVSQEKIIKTAGPLPKKIDSLKSLQSYAAHYSWMSSNYLLKANSSRQTVDSAKDPCLRMEIDASINQEDISRVEELFKEAKILNLLNIPSLNSVKFFFYLNPKTKVHQSEASGYFAPYLMKEYAHLLPNYEKLLSNLKVTLDNYAEQAEEFLQATKKLSNEELAEVLGIDNISSQQRRHFITRSQNIYNDILRVINSINFLVNHPALQVLDVYLFAEQSFFHVHNFTAQVEDIILSGHFLSANDEARNIEGHPQIKKFFHHRQTPLRSLYLMMRAIAFSLRDFANNFRALAQLPPIPEEIFAQGDGLIKVFELDESLPTIRTYLRMKKQREKQTIATHKMSEEEKEAERESWRADSNLASFNKMKQQQKNQKKSSPQKNAKRRISPKSFVSTSPILSKTSISSTKMKEEEEAFQPNNSDDLPEIKPSIGSRITNLLHAQDRELLKQLFLLKPGVLKHADINTLTIAVYKALVDQNKAHRAAEFLKRASDARIFTKGKEEKLLSKESLEYRLLPYLLQNIVHPNFNKEQILASSEFLRERVRLEKIMLRGDEIDTTQVEHMEKMLLRGEEVIKESLPLQHRTLLINLAHAWHKLSTAVEVAKGVNHKTSVLKKYEDKIVYLLKEAQLYLLADDAEPASVLEAYLLNYYLHQEVILKKQERLESSKIEAIMRRAAANMRDPFQKPPKIVHKVSPSGKFIGKYEVDNSIYHAITNDELGDYIIVTFERPVKDRKIPLFVKYNDKTYRTDVFGGSRLKPNPAKGDYGSLIGVRLEAADFFQSFFTSMESFWYGQRAFMPAKPDQKTKAYEGSINLATIPDERKFAMKGGLIVQDGFGYIKASLAKRLNLNPVERSGDIRQKNVAYQALHSYESEGRKKEAQELFNGARSAYLSERFKHFNADDKANALMCTLPKMTAIGVPVQGKDVLLPDDIRFREAYASGLLIGRNPYSAKRLNVVEPQHITYSDILLSLPVFQYSLTGYYDEGGHPVGSFFKGLLAVIPDEDWPAEFKEAQILVSSKDQKLNQLWLDKKTKDFDQNRSHMMNLAAMLVVKNEYHKSHLVGLPTFIAGVLAGDYDGDPYDLMPQKGYERVSAMVLAESKNAIPNPKPIKSFTPRQQMGNFDKILKLRIPINPEWNSINNRFNFLPKDERVQFIEIQKNNHRLGSWLGEDWEKRLDIKDIKDSDIITSEIQLGLKYGEDAYKTDVDIKSVEARDQEYQKTLNQFNKDPSIPYGNGLKKKLDEKRLIEDAMAAALISAKSANIVHKAFRGLARFVAEDETYPDWVSDDEEERGDCD